MYPQKSIYSLIVPYIARIVNKCVVELNYEDL